MYISLMNNQELFEQSFEMITKLFRTMMYGIFIYPLFVAGVETFNWGIFHFLNFETMKTMGLIFMILTLISFPLIHLTHGYFTRNCTDISDLARRLVYADIANLAISELITFYGVIIYITSANLKFFYLFFVISFIHLFTVRPSQKKWQKYLDIVAKR